jgi:hypothetical protein
VSWAEAAANLRIFGIRENLAAEEGSGAVLPTSMPDRTFREKVALLLKSQNSDRIGTSAEFSRICHKSDVAFQRF